MIQKNKYGNKITNGTGPFIIPADQKINTETKLILVRNQCDKFETEAEMESCKKKDKNYPTLLSMVWATRYWYSWSDITTPANPSALTNAWHMYSEEKYGKN